MNEIAAATLTFAARVADGVAYLVVEELAVFPQGVEPVVVTTD